MINQVCRKTTRHGFSRCLWGVSSVSSEAQKTIGFHGAAKNSVCRVCRGVCRDTVESGCERFSLWGRSHGPLSLHQRQPGGPPERGPEEHARRAVPRSARSVRAEKRSDSVAGTRNCHAQLPPEHMNRRRFCVVASNRPRVKHPSPSDLRTALLRSVQLVGAGGLGAGGMVPPGSLSRLAWCGAGGNLRPLSALFFRTGGGGHEVTRGSRGHGRRPGSIRTRVRVADGTWTRPARIDASAGRLRAPGRIG